MLTLLLMMALMTIFAAAILPEITFEIKRDREEEMIHRGVQYSRAIRAYYKKFGRYPAKIEDLENTNQLRVSAQALQRSPDQQRLSPAAFRRGQIVAERDGNDCGRKSDRQHRAIDRGTGIFAGPRFGREQRVRRDFKFRLRPNAEPACKRRRQPDWIGRQ